MRGGVGPVQVLDCRDVEGHRTADIPECGSDDRRIHLGGPALVVGHHREDALVQIVGPVGPELRRHSGKDRRSAAVVVRMSQPEAMSDLVDERAEIGPALGKARRSHHRSVEEALQLQVAGNRDVMVAQQISAADLCRCLHELAEIGDFGRRHQCEADVGDGTPGLQRGGHGCGLRGAPPAKAGIKGIRQIRGRSGRAGCPVRAAPEQRVNVDATTQRTRNDRRHVLPRKSQSDRNPRRNG